MVHSPMVNVSPMKIPGNWREGYVLDYHTVSSEFLGYDEFGHAMFDTVRSEMGELLYRLKYRGDQSVSQAIVDTASAFIASWRPKLGFIVPVPATRQRKIQPVVEIAQGLSATLNVPVCADCITRSKDTPELKNVYDYHKRLELLESAFSSQATALDGQDVLLFDDLYRSGATMNAIASVLRVSGRAADVYAFALTRTRSAS